MCLIQKRNLLLLLQNQLRIPHVEFMKQLKRGDASTSTTKIKIRHNILNAVEEALAGG